MKKENAIEVSNISKMFKVYYDKGGTLKEKLLFSKRRAYEERVVLDNISFEIKKGEAIGLIGHNGCGKSTTLKMLTRIMYPDSGKIEMQGRISSIIELGAGFHPDMSGRENIYINASIFGLTRKEIEEKLDDIISYSELEEFIDNPVRTYSSGMYMRLAFAVAINVNAEILLIDEVLAVGDEVFQTKCFNRMKEIKASGVTIVFVSHSLSQVEEICDRSIWIHKGKIKAEGEPKDVHAKYKEYVMERREEIADKEVQHERKKKEEAAEAAAVEETEVGYKGNGKVDILDVALCDENGKEKKMFSSGATLKILVKYKQKIAIEGISISVGITSIEGALCSSINTLKDAFELNNIAGKIHCLELDLKDIPLAKGLYVVDVAALDINSEILDYKSQICRFEIVSKNQEYGVVKFDHEWMINEKV